MTMDDDGYCEVATHIRVFRETWGNGEDANWAVDAADDQLNYSADVWRDFDTHAEAIAAIPEFVAAQAGVLRFEWNPLRPRSARTTTKGAS